MELDFTHTKLTLYTEYTGNTPLSQRAANKV